MKKNVSNSKIIISSFLIAIILLMLIVLFTGKKLFTNETYIYYPDECIEKYVNSILVSELCTRGRELANTTQTPIFNIEEDNIKWNHNITIKINLSNLTI